MKKTTPQIMVIPHFKMFVQASISGRRLTPSGKKITSGTIRSYQYALRLLQEYETKKEVTLRIQLLHRASLRTLQKEKNYWARFFTRFSIFLYKEKEYYDNYVGNIFKVLKTFFNYLETCKGFSIGNYHKSFRVPIQTSEPVVLQPEQLNFLITNIEFDNKLTPCLKRAKDIFVFGCTVALRVSDLMNLKKTNMVYAEKEIYLIVNTQKTGTEVRIPLPDYAIKIIERNKRRAGKYILPRLSVTNINIQIKKLIEKAGWTQVLTKTISRQGKVLEIKSKKGITWQFHQHITAHTMRRTAITTLLILGVPEMIVRKISGHAPGSKEFYKYVAIAQEYLNQEVQTAYKKLVNEHTYQQNKSNI
jgi:integrase